MLIFFQIFKSTNSNNVDSYIWIARENDYLELDTVIKPRSGTQ